MPLRPIPARGLLARVAFVILALLAPGLRAEILFVGPRPPELSLRDAIARANDGDTIALLEGEYDGQVAVVEHKKLTIRGLGKRPLLRAGGRHAEGKAILVVRGGEVVLENLEFRGARVPDGNGAGVRLDSGKLTVRRCAFYDNEMGILTGNDPATELEVIDSQFGDAPRAAGTLPHLLYAGRIARLSITGSRFHEGFEGHLIKSRAKESLIRYNLIYDGWAGEASYEIDLPNGGRTVLLGNVIGQGPDAQNRVLVSFASEGDAWPGSALYMAHNTLVSHGVAPAWFLRVWQDKLPEKAPVVVINNVLAGIGLLSPGTRGTFEANRHTLGRWLRAQTLLDFSLPVDSWLRGAAIDPGSAAADAELVPRAEFQLPLGTRALKPPAAWSPGAFQQ